MTPDSSDLPRPAVEEEPSTTEQPRIDSVFDIPGMRSDWRWPVCAAIAVAVLFGGSSLNVDHRILAPLVFAPLLVGSFFLFRKMARDYAFWQSKRGRVPSAPRIEARGTGIGQKGVPLMIIGVGMAVVIVVGLLRLGVL